MSDNKNINSYEAYKDDPLLRREAGEGWHPDGLNDRVLGAIVVRELLIDDVVKRGVGDAEAQDDYFAQAVFVGDLKKASGVDDPPALVPEIEK